MSEGTATADAPTIVLVHGAFADGSSCNGVIERLQQHGYTVVAPANPLRGVGVDSAYPATAQPQAVTDVIVTAARDVAASEG